MQNNTTDSNSKKEPLVNKLSRMYDYMYAFLFFIFGAVISAIGSFLAFRDFNRITEPFIAGMIIVGLLSIAYAVRLVVKARNRSSQQAVKITN